MKKGVAFYVCRFLLTVAVVFSFYIFNVAAVMAQEQMAEPAAESEQMVQSEAEQEPEQAVQSEAEQEPEQAVQSEAEQEPEQAVQSEAEQEPEQAVQSEAEREPEQMVQPAADPETGDDISTGRELTEWLDSHKTTGGMARLTDHVILDDKYEFCFAGPLLFVNTDRYTITVNGEVEMMSNQHLVFSGQPDGNSIFCVVRNGMLSLQGVTVTAQSEGDALWQEEGAGLVVSDCDVSGDIHYAETPFVMFFEDSLCAVVEKGQTLSDALPSQINCEVNCQGGVRENEAVCVSWNQEGSEKQQEERRRFRLQGTFSGALSAQPLFCTVVYNDYPLTFTDMEVVVKDSQYIFRGGFTVPEESLPFTVVPEYSFDGENWFPETEQKAESTNAGLCMVCPCEPGCSAIYIRLKWDNHGTVYFSNVLRYSSDNLECAEDIGGSRGGGTSIIKPPEEPQESDDTTSPGEEEPDQTAGGNTNSDDTVPEAASGKNKTESVNKKSHRNSEDSGISESDSVYTDESQQRTDTPNTSEEPQQRTEALKGNELQQRTDTPNTGEGLPRQGETADTNERPQEPAERTDTGQDRPSNTALTSHREEQMLYAESKAEPPSQISERALRADSRLRAGIIFAAVAVILSAAGGIAGWYVHFRAGTKGEPL